MHRFYSLFFPGFINSAETVPGRKFPTRKLRFYCIEAAGYDKIKWIFYKHCTDSECDENTELRLLKYFNKEAHILPENENQPLVKVAAAPPDGKEKGITNGIYAEDEVLAGIRDAQAKIAAEQPDRIITIGGNCMVSLAAFDYLHGKYGNAGAS